MNKIGVIGDRESVLCFMAVGFSVRCADTPERVSAALSEFVSKDYAAVFITEQAAELVKDEISRLENRPTPAVTLIPSVGGKLGTGMDNIKKSVERAVGADILFKDNG